MAALNDAQRERIISDLLETELDQAQARGELTPLSPQEEDRLVAVALGALQAPPAPAPSKPLSRLGALLLWLLELKGPSIFISFHPEVPNPREAGAELEALRAQNLIDWDGQPAVYRLTEAGKALCKSIVVTGAGPVLSEEA